MVKENTNDWLIGEKSQADVCDFSEEIAFSDHKIKFVCSHCRDKSVLDLGCVQHNPDNYKSKYWLHKAICACATNVIGLDMYEPGIKYLVEKGYNVIYGDAENFNLYEKFDCIVAGDLIEHLNNAGNFLKACRNHLHKGGKLLISTPNPWYWRNIVKAALFSEVRSNPEHTTWYCPVNLSQFVRRYNFILTNYTYGSRYLKDRLMPLPKAIKHTSFHALMIAD